MGESGLLGMLLQYPHLQLCKWRPRHLKMRCRPTNHQAGLDSSSHLGCMPSTYSRLGKLSNLHRYSSCQQCMQRSRLVLIRSQQLQSQGKYRLDKHAQLHRYSNLTRQICNLQPSSKYKPESLDQHLGNRQTDLYAEDIA